MVMSELFDALDSPACILKKPDKGTPISGEARHVSAYPVYRASVTMLRTRNRLGDKWLVQFDSQITC